MKGKRYKKDVAEFSLDLLGNVSSLQDDLKQKTYRHGGYQHFKISDPKPREIHKASVRDRLLHHAVYRILYLYFDKKFIYDSYSCRNNKGTHRAVNRLQFFSRIVSRNYSQNCFVLKCDIRRFFPNIDHTILKNILSAHIIDHDTRRLLNDIIDSFHTENKLGCGLPLGNLTSQLLANVYMNELDHYVKRNLKVRYYIRYADDFIILSDSVKWLRGLVPEINNFLINKLKLHLHPNKIYIKSFCSGIDFLGWVNFPHHRVLRTSTIRKILRNCHHKGVRVETLQSYLGLMGHGNCYRLRAQLIRLLKNLN